MIWELTRAELLEEFAPTRAPIVELVVIDRLDEAIRDRLGGLAAGPALAHADGRAMSPEEAEVHARGSAGGAAPDTRVRRTTQGYGERELASVPAEAPERLTATLSTGVGPDRLEITLGHEPKEEAAEPGTLADAEGGADSGDDEDARTRAGVPELSTADRPTPTEPTALSDLGEAPQFGISAPVDEIPEYTTLADAADPAEPPEVEWGTRLEVAVRAPTNDDEVPESTSGRPEPGTPRAIPSDDAADRAPSDAVTPTEGLALRSVGGADSKPLTVVEVAASEAEATASSPLREAESGRVDDAAATPDAEGESPSLFIPVSLMRLVAVEAQSGMEALVRPSVPIEVGEGEPDFDGGATPPGETDAGEAVAGDEVGAPANWQSAARAVPPEREAETVESAAPTPVRRADSGSEELDEVEEIEEIEEPSEPGSAPVEDPSPPAAVAAEDARSPKPPSPPDARRKRAWYDDVFGEHFLEIEPSRAAESAEQDAEFLRGVLELDRGASILDVGCGSGRHALALGRRGFAVTGVDSSLPQLLAAGQNLESEEAQVDVAFLHGDMRSLPGEQTYDAVICLGTTFGYFEEEQNRICAEGMAARVKPGGKMVIQVFNRDFLAHHLPCRSWWQGKRCMVLDEAEMNFFANRLRVHRTIIFEDGRQFEHYMFIRAFTVQDLGKILSSVGLKVIEVSGSRNTRGRFYGADSPEIWIVAERRLT